MQIRTFRHKGLQRLFDDDDSRGFSPAVARRVANVLYALNAAESLHELSVVPGWRLHPLKGARAGVYSVRVTANWRLTFRVIGTDVYEVDFEDYH